MAALPSPTPEPDEAEPHPPDADLVAQAQSGDPSGFDQLVIRYQQRLYGVIYNMTLNHDDTNDLLMETLAKAYRSIHGYKGDAAFYTWLYRIAVNRTLNFLQRNKERYKVSLQDPELDLEQHASMIEQGDSASPDRKTNLEELQKKLNEALMKLSNEHRAVVTLFDIQGLSHAEIAQIVNCSEGTVRSRLFYAHKYLQKYLKNYA